MALKKFNSLNRVPTHYDRDSASDYGTRGRLANFSAENDFVGKLDNCFKELFNILPLGQAEVITSAGAGTRLDDPQPGDEHSQARAFDLDGIFWAGRKFVTLDDGFLDGDR